MTKQDLAQAVKACIIIDLEEQYNRMEALAYYASALDERIIILEKLRDTYPILNSILQKSIDELTSIILIEQLKYVKRDLTKSDELIIEQIVNESKDEELYHITERCKKLLNIN